ncbi:MAG TPA: hypothetical protein EYP98_18435 [Planctomycetes bacterium]|nr:hypothetical protein [Planctomycetota bacterium]
MLTISSNRFDRIKLMTVAEGNLNAEGAIGTLIMNKQTAEDATALLANLKGVSENLLSTDNPLGVLLNDKDAARDLQGILDNVDHLIADARKGKGILGQILQNDKMAQAFNETVDNLNLLLRKVNDPDAGALGALTSNPVIAKDLAATIANLRHTTEQLTQMKGLLGALINDENLAIRFRRILTQVSRAIEDAREAAPISNFIQVLLGTM